MLNFSFFFIFQLLQEHLSCQNDQHGVETTAREKFINFDELQDVILHIDGGGAVAEVGASTTEAAVSSTGSSNENDVNHLRKELARLKKENAEKEQKFCSLKMIPQDQDIAVQQQSNRRRNQLLTC